MLDLTAMLTRSREAAFVLDDAGLPRFVNPGLWKLLGQVPGEPASLAELPRLSKRGGG